MRLLSISSSSSSIVDLLIHATGLEFTYFLFTNLNIYVNLMNSETTANTQLTPNLITINLLLIHVFFIQSINPIHFQLTLSESYTLLYFIPSNISKILFISLISIPALCNNFSLCYLFLLSSMRYSKVLISLPHDSHLLSSSRIFSLFLTFSPLP